MKYQNLTIFSIAPNDTRKICSQKKRFGHSTINLFLLHFLLMFLLPRFMIFLIKEDYKVIAVGQRQFYCLIKNFNGSVRTDRLST